MHSLSQAFLSASVVLSMLCLAIPGIAQPTIRLDRLNTPPLHYICPIVPSGIRIKIDGVINEAEWGTASWTSDFQDIEGKDLPQPGFRTRARMLWDKHSLYIAAELEEPNLWATLRNHDDIIFRDNDFEVFLSGKTDDLEYYEFEVNAFNTLFDLLLPKPYRDGGKADIPWNAPGFESAVQMSGTLNVAGDKDKGWTIEMRIPFTDLSKSGKGMPPSPGSVWRINFSRVEYDVEEISGKYVKLKDEAGKDRPEHNWVWSPQGIIDMHFPERWGYLTFLGAETPGGEFIIMEDYIEKNLWMIYYAQRKHFRETGTYLESVSDPIFRDINLQTPKDANLSIKTSGKHWSAMISTDQHTYSIDGQGNLKKKLK